MKKIFVILVIISSGLTLQAQRGWEVGGWLGTSHYFGDLNPNFQLNSLGTAGGGFMRFNFNNRLAFKMGLNYLTIGGSDKFSDNSFQKIRNLNFRSKVLDGVGQFEFNFLPYNHGSVKEFYTPYVFAGINVFRFNPQAHYDSNGDGTYDTWADLNPLGTEGQFKGEEYYLVQGGLAYGLGVKVSFNFEWSLELEFSSRYLYTDFLDDVSGSYPEFDDLNALHGSLAVELSDRSGEILPETVGLSGRQRGNAEDNDFYAMMGISVVYYFGSIRCPNVSY